MFFNKKYLPKLGYDILYNMFYREAVGIGIFNKQYHVVHKFARHMLLLNKRFLPDYLSIIYLNELTIHIYIVCWPRFRPMSTHRLYVYKYFFS